MFSNKMHANQVCLKTLKVINVKVNHNQTHLGQFLFSTGRQCFIYCIATLQVVPAIVHGSETSQKQECLLVAQNEMFQAIHKQHGVYAACLVGEKVY